MAKRGAIIFDVDGTAIDSPHSMFPTQRLVKALKAAEDIYHLCAATGRVWSFANPVLKALNLTDPCIISAGTQICDPQTSHILWQCAIKSDDIGEVIEVIRHNPIGKVLYNDYDEDTYFNKGSMPLEPALDQPIYFMGLIFVPEDKAAETVAKFSHIKNIACTPALAQFPGYRDILITNKEATKEHAIAELLKIIEVPKASTIGIGDGHNDVHLFQAVHRKIAMDNAVQELKDAADEVIGSVSNDGMAKYLERIIR